MQSTKTNSEELNEAIDHLGEMLADKNHDFGCEECRRQHIQLYLWLVDYRRLLNDIKRGNEIIENHRYDEPSSNLSKPMRG